MRPDARLASISLLLLFSGCTAYFGSGIPNEKFPPIADPGVRSGVLDNGLTYYIRRNTEPLARAELRLVVNAGSVLEDDDQRGLAHIVEHLAFAGTESFGERQIVNYLESVGMGFGPDVNAYTSFDETVYMLTLPTDSAGVLETGVQILSEWATSIAFDSVQVEKERTVVIEEWRLGQGAGSRIQKEQFPTLAARSRYAERLPIGTPESLAMFTHDALQRFYADWYRPDLMAVVAVGAFDEDEMERLIRQRFGSIPARPDGRTRREFPVPPHEQTLISLATDRELTSSSVSVYLKRPPEEWRDVAAYYNWVVRTLASSMLVNRLNEFTQLVDSPFLDVSSFQGRFVRSLSTFVLNARIPQGGVERGLQQLLLEIERAARHGFEPSEMEREKSEMLRMMEQRYAERDKITSGSFAADYVSHFLYGGTILDAETEYQLYTKLIPAVTKRDVDQSVQNWTQTQDRVLLISTPEDSTGRIPSYGALRRLVEAAPTMRVAAYRDSISGAPLIRVEPVAGTIVAEEIIPEVDVLSWTLSNGAKVFLRPTDFREEEILFAARSPGGTSLVSDEDYIPALTAAAVVQSGGLGELSGNDLRKRLAGRLVGVGADISRQYEGLSGATSKRDLEMLFQLAYLKFTAPRPDSSAFLAYQEQARDAMLNRSANPQIAFRDTLQIALTQNHPRARPPSVELFERLDMVRSFEIYKERFADAGDFTFYLVGNFEPDSIRPFVETYLASLPASGNAEVPRDVGVRPPRGVVEKVVRRGVEPRAATQLVFTGSFDFNRDNVLAIQALADVLRIRLRESLREDLGGTYGVSVSGGGGRDPDPSYQISIGFGSDPERMDELIEALFADIESLKAEGPSEQDMAKVRETQFRNRETQLRRNSFWLAQMLLYNSYGWDLNSIPSTAVRELDLTADDVREAAGRYLDMNNYVHVTLVPEAN